MTTRHITPTAFESTTDRVMRLIEHRSGTLVAQAIVAHRSNWQGIQQTNANTETSCLQILELGEVTRRLRNLLRQMVREQRQALKVANTQPVSPDNVRVIALASSRQWQTRDIQAVWSLYRDCMGDYRAMYDAYMFKMDVPVVQFPKMPALEPVQMPADWLKD